MYKNGSTQYAPDQSSRPRELCSPTLDYAISLTTIFYWHKRLCVTFEQS